MPVESFCHHGKVNRSNHFLGDVIHERHLQITKILNIWLECFVFGILNPGKLHGIVWFNSLFFDRLHFKYSSQLINKLIIITPNGIA